jgi:hypothetical protein
MHTVICIVAGIVGGSLAGSLVCVAEACRERGTGGGWGSRSAWIMFGLVVGGVVGAIPGLVIGLAVGLTHPGLLSGALIGLIVGGLVAAIFYGKDGVSWNSPQRVWAMFSPPATALVGLAVAALASLNLRRIYTNLISGLFNKPQMLRNILIGFLIFVTTLAVINRYLFSWAGYILYLVGRCEYKYIRVADKKGGRKMLSYPVDFVKIASALGPNPNYEVKHDILSCDLRRRQDQVLVVKRNFGGLKYIMQFINSNNGGRQWNYLSLSNGAVRELSLKKCSWDKDGDIVVSGSRPGEKCSTPDHYLKRNVYRMIRDLPLGFLQRAELKGNVRVVRR